MLTPWDSIALSILLVLGQTSPDPAPPTQGAMALWREGQEAMKTGDFPRALASYQASQKVAPWLARTQLSLAATYIQVENPAKAAEHLRKYLELEPSHWQVRQQLADLLLQLGHKALARQEFLHHVHAAQSALESGVQLRATQKDFVLLVHGHGRLMELAEDDHNFQAYHLHRGLGLFFLAKSCEQAAISESNVPVSIGQKKPESNPGPAPQEILLKSIHELMETQKQAPSEPRSAWYLHQAWKEMGQRALAEHWLRIALQSPGSGELHPAEMRHMALAKVGLQMEQRLLRR